MWLVVSTRRGSGGGVWWDHKQGPDSGQTANWWWWWWGGWQYGEDDNMGKSMMMMFTNKSSSLWQQMVFGQVRVHSSSSSCCWSSDRVEPSSWCFCFDDRLSVDGRFRSKASERVHKRRKDANDCQVHRCRRIRCDCPLSATIQAVLRLVEGVAGVVMNANSKSDATVAAEAVDVVEDASGRKMQATPFCNEIPLSIDFRSAIVVRRADEHTFVRVHRPTAIDWTRTDRNDEREERRHKNREERWAKPNWAHWAEWTDRCIDKLFVHFRTGTLRQSTGEGWQSTVSWDSCPPDSASLLLGKRSGPEMSWRICSGKTRENWINWIRIKIEKTMRVFNDWLMWSSLIC